MPVLDRKTVSVDNDDEHHKKLMNWQGKNNPNDDTSQVFISIPIGSTVAVQWEDGEPWTHGTIVGMGNHNHHSRSYKIQVTTTGRIITCNRQHIKPIPITAEDYMCYKARKHTKTDPLDAFLDHIPKNPHSYSNKAISNKRDDNQNTHGEHGVRNKSKGSKQEQIEEMSDSTRMDNDNINEGDNLFKTRYRRIVRKPDRLMY